MSDPVSKTSPTGFSSEDPLWLNERVTREQTKDFLINAAADLNREQIIHNMTRKYIATTLPLPYQNERMEDFATRVAYMAGGAGEYLNQLSNFFRNLDRYDKSALPMNSAHSGFTFFTRPRLNLSDTQLIMDPCFTPLMTRDPETVPYAIKCLLDTNYAARHLQTACKSNKFNPFNALLVPCCNALRSATGFPDRALYTETSPGGYYQEDQTLAIGGDNFSKTYDITFNFRDIQGGPIMALFDYWTKWIANSGSGIMVPYKEAIDDNRLDYTCSIYRFVTDPTRRRIMYYAKCTGCYPVGVPLGSLFNISENEVFVTAAQTVSIPFKINKIEYNDPRTLIEFNELMDRYAKNAWDNTDESKPIGPGEEDAPRAGRELTYSVQAINNYLGLPYIVTTDQTTELVWRKLKEEREMFEPVM